MINKPGAAKTGHLKELTARKKTGPGVTKAVESLKINSLGEVRGSADIWNPVKTDGTK